LFESAELLSANFVLFVVPPAPTFQFRMSPAVHGIEAERKPPPPPPPALPVGVLPPGPHPSTSIDVTPAGMVKLSAPVAVTVTVVMPGRAPL
jgi:hypothetical protein